MCLYLTFGWLKTLPNPRLYVGHQKKNLAHIGLLLRKCVSEMHMSAHKHSHCEGAMAIQKYSRRVSSTQVNFYTQTIASQFFQTTFSTVCAWTLQKHVKCTHLMGGFGQQKETHILWGGQRGAQIFVSTITGKPLHKIATHKIIYLFTFFLVWRKLISPTQFFSNTN